MKAEKALDACRKSLVELGVLESQKKVQHIKQELDNTFKSIEHIGLEEFNNLSTLSETTTEKIFGKTCKQTATQYTQQSKNREGIHKLRNENLQKTVTTYDYKRQTNEERSNTQTQ